MASQPEAGWPEILGGIQANWPRFLLRKSVLAGALFFVALGLIRQRTPPGSGWLLAFIPLYTLALAPTYFTARASALPELAGILLAVAAAALCFPNEAEHKRNRQRSKHAGKRLDPSWLGLVIVLLCLGGIGYNGWRQAPILREQLQRRHDWFGDNNFVYDEVLEDQSKVYGPLHRTSLVGQGNPFNLPGPAPTRLWLDDPRVAARIDLLWQRVDWEDVLEGRTAVEAIVLSNPMTSRQERFLAAALSGSDIWVQAESWGSGPVYVKRKTPPDQQSSGVE
jgi:hypothetical protein